MIDFPVSLQSGDIILYAGKNVLSKAIGWWTYSKWSHVYYVISDGVVDITYPRVQLIQYDQLKGCVLILRWNTPFCPEDVLKWDWFLRCTVGKRYDVRGLLSFVLRMKVGNKSYYFCSEAGFDAAGYIGRKIWLRKDPSWITPQDYEESLAFSVIHEGIL